MDRNTENRYAELDTIDRPRSTWNRNKPHKTTFNAGYLIPFYVNMDIIPGTTIKNTTTAFVRMSTPIYPTMDNLYLDTYWFKCSKFWYWEHFKEMMGENKLGAWAQTVEYAEPKIQNGEKQYGPNDAAVYMGCARQGINNSPAWSKLAINAYIDVWNNWFRDQNLQAPIEFDTTDANLDGDGTIQTGYGLLPVQKFHDYFTSCLPEPQKGTAISTPLGTSAPIVGNGIAIGLTNGTTNIGLCTADDGYPSLVGKAGAYGVNVSSSSITSGASIAGVIGLTTDPEKSGMIADLTAATAATINALRLAFATQRILESDARFGTRYREILKGHFGVTASDEAINVPEYLGGNRVPINIETVLQNSATSSTSPLGQTGAFSVTTNINEDFTKSFTKDDILIGVACVRADHTYQQGVERQFTRTTRLDRYWPEFSHIGNQPVYNYEIYAQGTAEDNEVFGYKEAWQEYIYDNARVSGELSSDYAQSLDAWTYADDYDSLPVLSDEWIREPQTFIDRTLAVQSTTQNQFIADFYVDQIVSAPIPLNRVPGLIDHF